MKRGSVVVVLFLQKEKEKARSWKTVLIGLRGCKKNISWKGTEYFYKRHVMSLYKGVLCKAQKLPTF